MKPHVMNLALVLFTACTSAAAPAPAPAPDPIAEVSKPPAKAKVTRVEPSLVCMVNNQFMGTAQIPVVVEGKTYFGCCEMCKSRLAQDPTSRAATDPVSGASVDKSVAVIGREGSGAVLYFESAKNLELYASR
jgi:YHS domain-containing protein